MKLKLIKSLLIFIVLVVIFLLTFDKHLYDDSLLRAEYNKNQKLKNEVKK